MILGMRFGWLCELDRHFAGKSGLLCFLTSSPLIPAVSLAENLWFRSVTGAMGCLINLTG